MPKRGARIGVISIGINYKGQSGELKGCVNDSKNFMAFVNARFGRHLVHKVQMLDTLPKASSKYPSKRNIQRQLTSMVREASRRRLTHVWLHYSGHGTQVRDRNGDERDRKDEALVPADHRRAGYITDDWLLAKFINKMSIRCHVFGLIDACHSESMLDLRFDVEPRGRRLKTRLINKRASSRARAIMISGCRDSKYSYDAYDKQYGASGAMTVAFLRSMIQNRRSPLVTILKRMRYMLRKRGYPQIPQLSSTRKLGVRSKIPGMGTL